MKFRKAKSIKTDKLFFQIPPLSNQSPMTPYGFPAMYIPVTSSTNLTAYSTSYMINTQSGSATYTAQNFSLPNMSISINHRSFRPISSTNLPTSYIYSSPAYTYPPNDSSVYSNPSNLSYSNPMHQTNWPPSTSQVPDLMSIDDPTQTQNRIGFENEDEDGIKPGQVSEAVFDVDENDLLDFGENESETSQESAENNSNSTGIQNKTF